MMVTLKKFCIENDFNCVTCRRSFENYYAPGKDSFILFCENDNRPVNENFVCMDYTQKLPLKKD